MINAWPKQTLLILSSAFMVGIVTAAEDGGERSDALGVPEVEASRLKSSELLGSSLFDSPASVGMDASTNALQRNVGASSYESDGVGLSGRTSWGGGLLTSPTKGRAIRFENGVFVYPSATFGLGHNDNVTASPDNKIGSKVLNLQPEIVAELKNQGDRYTLSYQGNYARHLDSAIDSYNNHDLWLAGDNYFTSRASTGWGVGYLERIDPRGTTQREASAAPDHWRASTVRGVVAYGAKGAIGRIELEGAYQSKRYTNNRNTTSFGDVDLSSIAGRFMYRVMPKTSLLVEVRNVWANYVNAVSSLDNTDLRVFAGVEWDAAAKTTGTLKLGRAYKKFDSGIRADYSDTSWEAAIRWSPLTYSTVDFLSSRSITDSTGVGDFVVDDGMNVAWIHKWSDVVSSRITVGRTKSVFRGDTRVDYTDVFNGSIYRVLSPNLRLGLDYSVTDRNSNFDFNDFRRNVLMVKIDSIF